MLEVVVPVVLLANGLAAGVLLWTQLGGWPFLVSLPPDRYVHAHAFFSIRFDPFMPVCIVLAALGGVVLVVLADSPVARVLHLVAALLCAASIAISLAKNVPINRWLATLDPNDLPEDFASRDPRGPWGAWNARRTKLVVAALVLQGIALGLLL